MIESGHSVYLAVIWVGETIVSLVSMGAWQMSLSRRNQKQDQEDRVQRRQRMKLAMVRTCYRITFYIQFKREGFQLYQLK